MTSSSSDDNSSNNNGEDNKNNSYSSYNVFRDSPLRYAGYANEVGESFRYQFPRLVGPSYAIAFGYCLADSAATGWRAYYYHHDSNNQTREHIISGSCSSKTVASEDDDVDGNNNNNNNNNNKHAKHLQRRRRREAVIGALDTLLWQSLASVMIPGACINGVVKAARYSVLKVLPPLLNMMLAVVGRQRQRRLPGMLVTWYPTAAGLGSIPFIVHPIDASVDYLLDRTVRPMYYGATMGGTLPPP